MSAIVQPISGVHVCQGGSVGTNAVMSMQSNTISSYFLFLFGKSQRNVINSNKSGEVASLSILTILMEVLVWATKVHINKSSDQTQLFDQTILKNNSSHKNRMSKDLTRLKRLSFSPNTRKPQYISEVRFSSQQTGS